MGLRSMKQVQKILLILFVLTLTQCKDECITSERCSMEPEVGPCKALIQRFYFDKSEKKCKVFMWGGCDGVVPFNTMEECEAGCSCTE
jgi:hypothetical protein